MYLIPVAWLYVALMMAVAEATNPNGTVLGAVITFVLYGMVPVSLVLYLMGAPGRKRKRRARDKAELDAANAAVQERGRNISNTPDAGGKAAADPVAPVRKEP